MSIIQIFLKKNIQFTQIVLQLILLQLIMNQGIYFGQIVIGPAGSGKSTYCKVMQDMAQTLQRNIIIFNLDPAAQYNSYNCDVDIKDLITLEDVMQEMQLGPNGGLLYCMEYLLQNQAWFDEQLNQYVGQDDYVLFDCPGQIQLYSDQNIFRELVRKLQNYGFSLISMYMMDINFIQEQNKFLSGILQALSIQITLQLPSMTVLTKCDLITDKQKLQKFINYFTVDTYDEYASLKGQYNYQKQLYSQIKKIINNNDIVSIKSLNLKDQDNIRDLLLEADSAIQYGQNLEPNDRQYEKAEETLNKNNSNNNTFDPNF